MGYLLAAWVGETPEDSFEAMAEMDQRFEHFRYCEDELNPDLAGFIEDLLQRWPVDSEEEFLNSPWQAVSLRDDARGDMAYLGLVTPVLPAVLEEIAAFARARELVLFDPQQQALL